MKQKLYGAIEAGGTKCICAVAYQAQEPLEKYVVPTTSPEETSVAIRAYFQQMIQKYGSIERIGIGAFGPVNLEKTSAHYGEVLISPKVLWRGFSWTKSLLGIAPVVMASDVEVAGLGEAFFGGGQGVESFIYLTVGTGIGGAAIVQGKILKGFPHAEMGHLLVPQEPEDMEQGFTGGCPSHKLCWEGMASGSAIAARWGQGVRIQEEQCDLIARYLAAGLQSLVACFAPQKILIGGGVGLIPSIMPLTRNHLARLSEGYFGERWQLPALETSLQNAQCAAEAGLIGALHLAITFVD